MKKHNRSLALNKETLRHLASMQSVAGGTGAPTVRVCSLTGCTGCCATGGGAGPSGAATTCMNGCDEYTNGANCASIAGYTGC